MMVAARGRFGAGLRCVAVGIAACVVALLPGSCDSVFGNLENVYDMRSESYDSSTFTSLLTMVSVTGGTFQMGSDSGNEDESPRHPVTVSAFSISRYEVRTGEYEELMGETPSYSSGTDYPVTYVAWLDAVKFCNALSYAENLEECYTIGFLGTGLGTSVSCDFTKSGYRLPTEAEWEFAARGGTLSQSYLYPGGNNVDAVAWYSGNDGYGVEPVGGKQANELGLYDLGGNAWEWCWDWQGSYESSITAALDPTGPSSSALGTRVMRGGAADVAAVRSTERHYDLPDLASSYVSFRPVRRP